MITSGFPPNSRYNGIETAILATSADTSIAYLRRRFIPSAERFSLLVEHTVSMGERLDQITANYVGDPEQFWRVCDANNAMRPSEMTCTIGGRLRITLPEGISGNSDA